MFHKCHFFFTLYVIIFDFYDILSLNRVFHSEAQYYLSVARLSFLRKASQFQAVKGPTEVSLAVLFESIRGGGARFCDRRPRNFESKLRGGTASDPHASRYGSRIVLCDAAPVIKRRAARGSWCRGRR